MLPASVLRTELSSSPERMVAFFSSTDVILPTLMVAGLALCLLVWSVRRSKQPISSHAGEDHHHHRRMFRPTSTLPWLQNTLDLAQHAPKMHTWTVAQYQQAAGRPLLIRSFGQPDVVMLGTPAAVEEVMKTQFDAFPKGPYQCGNLQDILGDGIFATDGAKWLHQRKTASNLFTARSLRDSMTTIVRKHTIALRRILDRASEGNGGGVDLFNLFNRFTIEAFAEIGFGIEMNCLEAKEEHPFQTAFDRAQRAIVMRFVVPSWLWKTQRLLSIGAEGQLKRDIDVIHTTVLDIVGKSLEHRQQQQQRQQQQPQQQQQQLPAATDIVSLFLDQYDSSANGEAFNPVYLRDIVVNFLIAGRDTTAQALSWFFLNASQTTDVVAKIRREIAETIPDLMDGTTTSPTLEQAQQLKYLEAALKETLRLHPSVPFLPKTAARDVVLSDDTFIRKGTNVGISTYSLGRMEHVWGPDAKEFKPERWIEPATGKLREVSAYKFFSFNAGPRMCLGKNLAMLEMKIVVASILSQYEVEVVNASEVTYDLSLTLPVRGEMRARITRVQPRGAT